LNGIFLTFEGLDGSGKTTQLRLLVNELRQRGFDVLSTCEPGGTILGKRLRESLLDEDCQVAPLAELLLFAADRAQHVQTLILPSLEKGKIVISDRYADATVAYQGAGRGFPSEIIDQTIELATGGLKPDLTLFFNLPTEESLSRTNSRVAEGFEQNRLDKEAAEFHQKVCEAYLQIAREEPERFRIVDAKGPINEIHKKVVEIVTQYIDSQKDKALSRK
jgi:dTMP kinase